MLTNARQATLLTYLLGLFVLILALGTRYYYLSHYQFFESTAVQVWQVQGRGLEAAPPQKYELDQLVENLKQNGIEQGFSTRAPLGPDKDELTAHRAPLYPVVRAGVEYQAEQWKETLPFTPASAMRWLQLLMGGLTCLFYYIIAWRAFGQHQLLALAVGIGTAIYPFWIINVAELEDGVLTTFLLAWSLCLGVGAGQRGGLLRSALFGLVLAALALTRASYLPFAIAVQLWFFLRCRQLPQGGLCGLLTLLCFCAGLAPWAYHTFRVFQTPVPIVNSAWYHLWAGNNEVSDGADYQWSMKKRIPGELATKLEQTNQSERYQMLSETVLNEIINNPGPTLSRRLKAFRQFLAGSYINQGQVFRPGINGTPAPAWVRPTLLLALTLLLFLALFGWRWSYGWKSQSAPLSLAIFWIPLPVLLSHAGPLHSSRLPLDGVLILLGCLALVAMLPIVGSRLLAGETELSEE